MTLWGGRFDGDADPAFTALNDSLPVDARLVQEDIEGSLAWAAGLEGAGVLSADEAASIRNGLADVADEAGALGPALAHEGDEDVHTWVERKLTERIGATARKLHTGRSRNDQVATDLRLWTRRAIADRRRDIRAVRAALIRLAKREQTAVIPGYTHLQRAQPILFAHWCLAYVDMLERDDGRLADAAARLDRCPLGSAALAGTTWPVDRSALAAALGFAAPTTNSLDAVSDRDFVAETIFALALCGVHLSRMAEDLVFYASGEAGFVELDDSVTSGSSLMPQKKNPDALELVRGKAARVLGNLIAITTTLKGLPLAYNKDLQEDKPALFDAMDTLALCLAVVPPLLDRLRVDHERSSRAAAGGHSNATELADALVATGTPFRDAHHAAGKLVRRAIDEGCALEDLPVEAMTSVAPEIDGSVYTALTIEAGLNRRDVPGGTAPARVSAALEFGAKRLETDASDATVRPARLGDVAAVTSIVAHWAAAGENLPLSRSDVLHRLQHFQVADLDGAILGCGALHPYGPALAEIRSIGVAPDAHGGGLGSRLTNALVDDARAAGVDRVFVLTRVPAFFARLGFLRVPMSDLPEKVFKDCVRCPRREACDEIGMILEIKP